MKAIERVARRSSHPGRVYRRRPTCSWRRWRHDVLAGDCQRGSGVRADGCRRFRRARAPGRVAVIGERARADALCRRRSAWRAVSAGGTWFTVVGRSGDRALRRRRPPAIQSLDIDRPSRPALRDGSQLGEGDGFGSVEEIAVRVAGARGGRARRPGTRIDDARAAPSR